jgi:hypothetical protein
MRPTNLDNIGHFSLLLSQGRNELFKPWENVLVNGLDGGNMHGGWERVIAGLAFVNMIVWMNYTPVPARPT